MKNNQQYKSKQKQTKNLIPLSFHGFPVDFSGKKMYFVKRNKKKNLSEWVGMGTTKCYKKAECSTKKTTRGQENHFVFFILSAKALWPPPFLAGSFAACLTPISSSSLVSELTSSFFFRFCGRNKIATQNSERK